MKDIWELFAEEAAALRVIIARERDEYNALTSEEKLLKENEYLDKWGHLVDLPEDIDADPYFDE